MVLHKLSPIYTILAQLFRYLFVALCETRYNQHNYICYDRPSIIDPFTLSLKVFMSSVKCMKLHWLAASDSTELNDWRLIY